MSKTEKMSFKKFITIILIIVGLYLYFQQTASYKEEVMANPEVNFQAQLEDLQAEKQKTETLIQATELKVKAEELMQSAEELEKAVDESKKEEEESPKANDLASTITNIVSKVEIETPQPEQPQPSRVSEMTFTLYSGKTQKGDEIIQYVKSNPNGLKLWQAFFDKHGQEVADTAAVSLFFENGTLWEKTTGVCNRKYQINGDYRNCNYADINSAGMDAGLKQINTFYQRYRIAKLGGPKCEPKNSRDITDPCTKSQVDWLHNVDNNIKISLDIYSESGFSPWYGYKKAFKK